VLRPDVQSLAWDDFDRADEAIEAGAAAARSALPRIKKFLSQAAHTAENKVHEQSQFQPAEALR
jgi:predicted acylesterase/phospholipase RssA